MVKNKFQEMHIWSELNENKGEGILDIETGGTG